MLDTPRHTPRSHPASYGPATCSNSLIFAYIRTCNTFIYSHTTQLMDVILNFAFNHLLLFHPYREREKKSTGVYPYAHPYPPARKKNKKKNYLLLLSHSIVSRMCSENIQNFILLLYNFSNVYKKASYLKWIFFFFLNS